jgi:hypothetical protein
VITPSYATKHYSSAHKRFLEMTITSFLEESFPKLFGSDIRKHLAVRLIELFETQLRDITTIRPGQCLWNAVAIDTRADYYNCRYVPVVLTLVDDDDVSRLAKGERWSSFACDVVARMLQEAYAQGALLSMRDLSLLLCRDQTAIINYRHTWEQRHEQVLPHPGSLQDMGSCVTHKLAIIKKVVYERQDPRQVSRATHHTQRAVDRYLQDFHRVRTCYKRPSEPEFICQVTGMSRRLVDEYLQIIDTHETCI